MRFVHTLIYLNKRTSSICADERNNERCWIREVMWDTAKVPNVWRSSNLKFQNVCDMRRKILDARFVCMNAKSTNNMECHRKYFYLQKVQACSFKWFCTQTIRTSHTVLHWKQLVVAGINKPCLCVTKEGSIRLKWHRHGNGNCCW